MLQKEDYYLSEDDIVIKEKDSGCYFLFPILPEFLPPDMAVDGGVDRDCYQFDRNLAYRVIASLSMQYRELINYIESDCMLEFFDNCFLKNLYLEDDVGVEFLSYNPFSRLYTDRNFNMDQDKFTLFFRNRQDIGDVVIGEGSVFETKNVSDYETACLLCDYLCQLHNKAVDLIFDSYISQDVL